MPVLDEFPAVGYREISGLAPANRDYHRGVTMTKADLKTYQQMLLELRERLNGDVSHLTDEALHQKGHEAGGNLSSMPIHMADLGTDAFEQENTLNLLHNEEQVLADIAAALERFDQGTYGRCEECQGEIPEARLRALPYARFCVECARKQENQ
jgi:RNA polymerase-binding transcription factor DksA